MSDLNFISSINTYRISMNNFNLFMSMFNTVDELYNSLHDSYGDAYVTEDELKMILNDFLNSMRNQLNISVEKAGINPK